MTDVVLITGANSGIGKATAVKLAAEGFRVYAGMRDTGKAEKLLDAVAVAGGKVEPLELDVLDDGSVRQATERVLAEDGRLDVLINNAGISFNGTTEDTDIEAAKLVFETNYWGSLRCIQAVLPRMRERGSGHIVNVSSAAGRIAALGEMIYSSSKWALECMSENLAQELAPFGVRVSVIEPGVTRTPMIHKNLSLPENTAYATAYRRMTSFYLVGFEANVRAMEVADTIHDALTTDEPRFRYTCAWGAANLVDGRSRMSDREWVDLGAAPTDDDYYERFEHHFGLDIRPQE